MEILHDATEVASMRQVVEQAHGCRLMERIAE